MAIGDARLAQIRIEAQEKLDPGLREAREKLRKFRRSSRRDDEEEEAKGGKKKVRLLAGMAKGIGKGIARFGTGFIEQAGSSVFDMATSGVKDAIDYERAMTRFQIATGRSNQETEQMRIDLSNMAKSMGIAKGDLLGGAAAYVALTGDSAGAVKQMELFARVSQASGAELGDIATTAASLKDNLKIDPAQFEQAFSTLISQGKAGAIELNNLAQELSGVAPQFTAFKNGLGIKGLVTLGASLQVARKGFGTAAEAATGLKALMVSLNRNASKFSGVKVSGQYGLFSKNAKTGAKSLKDFKSIIDGISRSNLARDPEALTKAFGSDEAKRAYDQLAQNRTLLGELEKEFEKNGVVAADAMAYQQSAAGQIEIAMQNMKEAVIKAFTPANIKAFADSMMKVAGFLGKIVDAFIAIQEFTDVRDTKNKNEEELVQLGEYSGTDRDMQQRSNFNARKNDLFWQAANPVLRMNRAIDLVNAVGGGALVQSSPLSSAAPAPVLPQNMVSRLPQAPTATEVIPALSPTGFGQSRAPVEITLRLEADVVARATAEAKSQRRKPGGR